MKKLHLDCEDLAVESFPTSAVEGDAGTVRAYVGTIAGVSCPAQLCHTDDGSLCGVTQAC